MMEWKARDYEAHSTLQAAMAERSLASLVLEGHERVLDVGCGDGKITAAIAARVPRGSVLGVDPSRDMIAFAAARFAAPEHPNLSFQVGDARDLPGGPFDLVVSFNALHWVREQGDALRSIGAALAAGGRALVRLVAEGPRRSLEDVFEDTRRSPEWAEHFQGFEKPYVHFTPEDYRSLAESSGLRVLSLRCVDEAWDFRSREGFLAFCRGTCGGWTRRLPEDRRDEFIAGVLDRYRSLAAKTPAEENTFKFYQLEVVLTPPG